MLIYEKKYDMDGITGISDGMVYVIGTLKLMVTTCSIRTEGKGGGSST